MDGGGEELGAGGLGLRQLGFQGVAQRQQLGHLRHDPLLLGQWCHAKARRRQDLSGSTRTLGG